MMQEVLKKFYVHIERLPEHMINKSFAKVDKKYETSSKRKLDFDQIKIEEHDDLSDNIYKDNVSILFNYSFLLKMIKGCRK